MPTTTRIYKRILETGAIWNARDEAGLIAGICAYLADRSLHREGRRSLALQEVPVNRGNAGEKVGAHLLDLLKSAAPSRAKP